MHTRTCSLLSACLAMVWCGALLAGLPSLGGTQSKVADLLLKEGTTAPDFTLKSVHDKPITLSTLLEKKKVVLVHFFFLGSDFCRMALPHLQQHYEEKGKEGLDVVCIDVSSSDLAGAIRGHWKASNFTMPVAKNNAGKIDVYKAYHGVNCPTSYLIGKDRKIISRWVGFLPKNGAERIKQELSKAGFP